MIRKLLLKEIRLSSSVLAYLFVLFGLMFFIPGYPILCAVFFVTLGLFHSFQYAREANDTVFSVLLPIARKDVVKGRFLFVCLIEACAFLLMTAVTVLRMTVFEGSPVYIHNPLMNANLFALGGALVIFGEFNAVFTGAFYRTAYDIGKPFIVHIVITFVLIGIFETLHHIPGLEMLNAFGTERIFMQVMLLAGSMMFFLILTSVSYKKACSDFDKIDL
ncbi:MAG: ABC-2 transporter permease [Erysipelotrichaceae bacterium]|nr:ABC-2 transporter permease [Erysipelotrichaceae bacterium]